MCGGYNSNLIKLAKQTIKEKYENASAKGNAELMPLGKKGYEHFSKNKFKVIDHYWNIFADPSFENVAKASKFAMDVFAKGEVDAVELVYSEFKNAATQKFTVEQFLPVKKT